MRRRHPLLILIAIGVVVTACGGSSEDSGGDPPDEVKITIENFSFGDPATAEVKDTILIVNEDGVAHTWTSDDNAFDSGSISPDGRFTFRFEEPGEYGFFCSIHPTMTGTIEISG
ncbi:MAG: cupredoxin domain-containing protein [Acidimicrobiia bacterium]